MNKKKAVLISMLAIASVFILQSVAMAATGTTTTTGGNDITATDPSQIYSVFSTILNITRYVGGAIFLILGNFHAFSLSAAAKNANKRAQAIEALLWTGVAIIIFFGGGALAGMLRGLAQSMGS